MTKEQAGGSGAAQAGRASIYCGCGRLVALARTHAGGFNAAGVRADKRGGQRRVLAGLPASSHFSCLAVAARTGRRANCARGIPLTRTRLP